MAIESFSAAGSSNIAAVTFDSSTDTLTVEFIDGEEYDYMNVPRSVYVAFSQAPSFGSYFHRQIKNRYAYEKR